tara:strand:+ start:221 stop:898 length:678 start_codon:yes stop_codon:yes gene_type:complete
MANEFTYSIDPDLEGDFLGQYSKGLGELTVQAPQLLQRSAEQQRQAYEQSQRTGLASLAEGAAQARAAAMGGAGQMAGGGGRAASMRQGGLSFGKRAADFAAEGAMRAAGLEKGLLDQQLQLKGELIPGALLAQAEAAKAPQDELTNLMNMVGVIEENEYWDSNRAKELEIIVPTLTPGSPAYRYAYMKLAGYYGAAPGMIDVGLSPNSKEWKLMRDMESQLGTA